MWLSLGTSAVAVCMLTFGMYMPRHHRPDIAAAYLVIGIGLAMIVVTLKQATSLGAGFGLGILGVLSVFRLRSTVIDHHDVAYFFATLCIGIIGGLTTDPKWLTSALCGGILVALFIGDHPRIASANQRQVVLLDRAHTDQHALKTELETLLNGKIRRVDVQELDMLRQTTLVDVRYRPNP
jgi:hypothetical protein